MERDESSSLLDRQSHLSSVTIRTNVPEQEEESSRQVGCHRPFLVEPLVFLYGLSFVTFMSISDQYLLYRLERGSALPSWVFSVDDADAAVGNSSLFTDIQEEYKTQSSHLQSNMALARGLPPIVMTLIINSYSDYAGRKCGLILPVIGGFCKSATYLIVEYYDLSLYYLIIGNLIEGLSGNHLTLLGSAFAYVSDCVSPQTRSFRYMLVNSVYFLAGSVSSFSIGYMIELCGYAACFWTMLGIYLGVGLYILLILPESLTDPLPSSSFSVLLLIRQTANAFKMLLKPRPTTHGRTILIVCLVVNLVYSVAFLGVNSLATVYVLGPPYNFTSIQIGTFIGVFNLCVFVFPAVTTRVFQMCMSEMSMGVISGLVGAVSYVYMGLAPSTVQLYIGQCLPFCAPSG